MTALGLTSSSYRQRCPLQCQGIFSSRPVPLTCARTPARSTAESWTRQGLAAARWPHGDEGSVELVATECDVRREWIARLDELEQPARLTHPWSTRLDHLTTTAMTSSAACSQFARKHAVSALRRFRPLLGSRNQSSQRTHYRRRQPPSSRTCSPRVRSRAASRSRAVDDGRFPPPRP